MLTEGKPLPDVTLADQDGNERSLSRWKGSWMLLYFYPKDDTPGCTKEACGFRDNWGKVREKGCEVIGVSADAVEKHKKFADKYDLPFTLLSDPDKTLIKACGAWQEKSMYGKKYMGIARISYLIDPEGNVAKAYPKVKAPAHAEQVLSDLEQLQS